MTLGGVGGWLRPYHEKQGSVEPSTEGSPILFLFLYYNDGFVPRPPVLVPYTYIHTSLDFPPAFSITDLLLLLLSIDYDLRGLPPLVMAA